MSKLQIFNNDEFGEIRTAIVNKEPMFCLMDICKSLEMKNPTMVAARLEDDEVTKLDLGGKNGETNFVSESGLYAVVLRSDKPNAKKFRKWVTSEVLPSIRKNGGYIAGQENLSDDELLEKAVLVAQKKIAERDKLIKQLEVQTIEMNKAIAEMKPIVNYVDTILQSSETVTVTQIAQDYGMSAKKFNKILQDLGIQRKVNGQWILYGKYQANGYVHSKTFDITRSDGRADVTMNTEWTQKGRLFLYETLKQENIYPEIEKNMIQLKEGERDANIKD